MSWEPQWSHYWNKSNNFHTIVSYSNNITKNIEYRLVWKVPGIRFSVIITDMIFPELKVFIGQLYLLLQFFSFLLKLTQCLIILWKLHTQMQYILIISAFPTLGSISYCISLETAWTSSIIYSFIFNPLNPINTAHMLTCMRSSTRIQKTYQWPHY